MCHCAGGCSPQVERVVVCRLAGPLFHRGTCGDVNTIGGFAIFPNGATEVFWSAGPLGSTSQGHARPHNPSSLGRRAALLLVARSAGAGRLKGY